MGEFGRLNWLGNFELVFMYNLLFEASTSLCFFYLFTKAVRDALLRSLREMSLLCKWPWRKKTMRRQSFSFVAKKDDWLVMMSRISFSGTCCCSNACVFREGYFARAIFSSYIVFMRVSIWISDLSIKFLYFYSVLLLEIKYSMF